MLSTERLVGETVGHLQLPQYYVVRYLVNDRPAIAKLAVVQGRLFCLKVRAQRDVEVAGRADTYFAQPSYGT